MPDYFIQHAPKSKSFIVVLNEFEENVAFNNGATRHLDFTIWSDSSFELLEIYYWMLYFYAAGFDHTIDEIKIDGDTLVINTGTTITIDHPTFIMEQTMVSITPPAAGIHQPQKLYAAQRIQFRLNTRNTSGTDRTVNARWHLVLRATTSQLFKVSVTLSES